MNWFVKLQRKYRIFITIVAWVVTVVFGAIYSQIENSLVAIAATVFFIASILFTVFAIKTNKSEKQQREENTFSEPEKKTQPAPKEIRIIKEASKQSIAKTSYNKDANQSIPEKAKSETISVNTIQINDVSESRKLDFQSFLQQLKEEEAAKKSIEQNNKPKKVRLDNTRPNISIKDITAAIPESDYKCNPNFTDKNFVFTGQLKNMEREEAYAAVISRGGMVKSSISRKVNYLVNADPTATTTKLKNAYDLQAQGYPIKIITDEEFMKMLEASPSETNAPKPIDYDTLTVIDFEVANEQFSSACALGVVVLHKGEIVERQYHLIKPPENRYLQSTIVIHGITPEQTENAEMFPQVWQKIKKFFQNTVVAAHNAVFDMTVLKATLKHYGITQPNFVYCCSIMISNLAIPYEENVRGTLDERCKYFDVPLPTHHHAMCDAEAAANIILQSFRKIASSDFSDFLAKQVSLKPFKEVKNSAIIGFARRAQSNESTTIQLNVL